MSGFAFPTLVGRVWVLPAVVEFDSLWESALSHAELAQKSEDKSSQSGGEDAAEKLRARYRAAQPSANLTMDDKVVERIFTLSA